jgi:hypothetical protein
MMQKYSAYIYLIIIKLFSPLYSFLLKPDKKVLTVFLYHDIGDDASEFASNHYLCVSNKTFEKQVNWIKNHFNIIHPDDLLANKKLPDYPALITFDDGFKGAFENGISYLIANHIPSLMFLNMGCISTGNPIVSSIACYLAEKKKGFEKFAERVGLKKPYHLTMTPAYYKQFLAENEDFDMEEVVKYQGALADLTIIRDFNNRQWVVYGNHLFDHWNASALTSDEFQENYIKNQEVLALLGNDIKMFAFPNGQPYTCFSQKQIDSLHSMGAARAFYSSGYLNKDGDAFLLNRTALTELDNSEKKLWSRYHIARIYAKSRFMQTGIK